MNLNEFVLLIPFILFIFDNETANNKTIEIGNRIELYFRETSLKEYNKYLQQKH